MTGQAVAAAVLFVVVAVVLTVWLRRDLRARNPWHGWIELGWTTDTPPVFTTIDVGAIYADNLRAYRLEVYYAMTIKEPRSAVKVDDLGG